MATPIRISRHHETPVGLSKNLDRWAIKPVAIVVVCCLAAGLTYLKLQRRAEARRATSDQVQPLPKVATPSEMDPGGERSKRLQEHERKLKERVQGYKLAKHQ